MWKWQLARNLAAPQNLRCQQRRGKSAEERAVQMHPQLHPSIHPSSSPAVCRPHPGPAPHGGATVFHHYHHFQTWARLGFKETPRVLYETRGCKTPAIVSSCSDAAVMWPNWAPFKWGLSVWASGGCCVWGRLTPPLMGSYTQQDAAFKDSGKKEREQERNSSALDGSALAANDAETMFKDILLYTAKLHGFWLFLSHIFSFGQ